MNQILQTKKSRFNFKFKNNKIYFKLQFYVSILFLIVLVLYYVISNIKLYNQEKYSSQVLNNYNITRLYANSNFSIDVDENIQSYSVIGIIKISSINVYYPIFASCNEELLKVAPCRLYGPLPGKIGNLCIAAHNYDNDKFFSNIKSLKIGDEILIYNTFQRSFSYLVSDIYEVTNTDLSPIYDYDNYSKQLTLITCNNLNGNRMIVKAICKNKMKNYPLDNSSFYFYKILYFFPKPV